MSDRPVKNAPRSPRECVDTACHRIRSLMDADVCESCAVKLTAREFGIEFHKLLILWLDY